MLQDRPRGINGPAAPSPVVALQLPAHVGYGVVYLTAQGALPVYDAEGRVSGVQDSLWGCYRLMAEGWLTVYPCENVGLHAIHFPPGSVARIEVVGDQEIR